MKVITVSKRIYRFAELSADAQATAASHAWELDFSYYFDDECRYILNQNFSDTEGIKIQWDYSYSQGSGLNLYGTFSVGDIVSLALEHAAIQGETLPPTPAGVDMDAMISIPPNPRYTYSKWDMSDYRDIIAEALADQGYDADGTEADTVAAHACARIGDICGLLYDEGDSMTMAYYDADSYAHEGVWYYADGTYACNDEDMDTFHPLTVEA